jgi:hypothetical protein
MHIKGHVADMLDKGAVSSSGYSENGIMKKVSF